MWNSTVGKKWTEPNSLRVERKTFFFFFGYQCTKEEFNYTSYKEETQKRTIFTILQMIGKLMKVYNWSREYSVTPLPMCFFFLFFSIHKRLYQQRVYSKSSKRASISSQFGRSCCSAQQSAIKDHGKSEHFLSDVKKKKKKTIIFSLPIYLPSTDFFFGELPPTDVGSVLLACIGFTQFF